MDNLVQQETPVLWDPQDPEDSKDSQVYREIVEHQDSMVDLVQLAHQDRPANQAIPVYKDHGAFQDPLEILELQVVRDCQDQWVHLVNPVSPDPQEAQDLLVLQAHQVLLQIGER